jgi:hypothetical protein
MQEQATYGMEQTLQLQQRKVVTNGYSNKNPL